jgi:lycopene cyclase domain-containing protein
MRDTTYLFLILIWALPVIIAQWLIGIDLLFKRWKVVLPGIVVPTLYLTIVDSIALNSHTWTINPAQSLNIFLPFIHVPIEEAIFFLVTNTMIVQGLIFLFAPEMRQRARRLLRIIRGGPQAIRQELNSDE